MVPVLTISLATKLVFMCIVTSHAEDGNTIEQCMELRVKRPDGKLKCVDCQRCPAGNQSYPPCHENKTWGAGEFKKTCTSCPEGTFQQFNDSTSPCRICSTCLAYYKVLKNCTKKHDISCSDKCQYGYYIWKAKCLPCCKCFSARDDKEPQCSNTKDKHCRSYDGRCKAVPVDPVASTIVASTSGKARTTTVLKTTHLPSLPTTITQSSTETPITSSSSGIDVSKKDISNREPVHFAVYICIVLAIIIVIGIIIGLVVWRCLKKPRGNYRQMWFYFRCGQNLDDEEIVVGDADGVAIVNRNVEDQGAAGHTSASNGINLDSTIVSKETDVVDLSSESTDKERDSDKDISGKSCPLDDECVALPPSKSTDSSDLPEVEEDAEEATKSAEATAAVEPLKREKKGLTYPTVKAILDVMECMVCEERKSGSTTREFAEAKLKDVDLVSVHFGDLNMEKKDCENIHHLFFRKTRTKITISNAYDLYEVLSTRLPQLKVVSFIYALYLIKRKDVADAFHEDFHKFPDVEGDE